MFRESRIMSKTCFKCREALAVVSLSGYTLNSMQKNLNRCVAMFRNLVHFTVTSCKLYAGLHR